MKALQEEGLSPDCGEKEVGKLDDVVKGGLGDHFLWESGFKEADECTRLGLLYDNFFKSINGHLALSS